MLKKHGDSVFVKFVETDDKYGHFSVYSKNIDVIDNTGRWIRYMENECIKLIDAGSFVPRKHVKKTVVFQDDDEDGSSVKIVEASYEQP